MELVETNLVQIIKINDLISSSSEELSTSSEESSAKLKEITDAVQSLAFGANDQDMVVKRVETVLRGMDESIGPITDQIWNYAEAVLSIALQTNILALNAGIEAS